MPDAPRRPRQQMAARRRPARSGGPAAARTGRPPRARAGARRAQQVVSELETALDAAAARPEPEANDFSSLGLPQPLQTALARRGVNSPFAIQSRLLPDAMAGRDVLGRAMTGSGKTLAYGLPMLTRLSQDISKRAPGRPRALVLVPTRELAKQVTDELEPLGHALGLRMSAVYGGAPIGRQIDRLARGVDAVVATPGRLIDLMERGSCRLDGVALTVIDEADHMADLGFLPPVTRILDETAPTGQRLLLSATLDRGVDKLVTGYLRDPAFHAVTASGDVSEDMDHRVFTLDRDEKVPVAAQIAGRPARTLFFVRTKHGADRLARQLDRAGVPASAIHGNLNQNQRQRALDAFSAGSPRVLVATDVAARGIHVDDVDLVIHFDPPNDHKDYLHRSGRTARAGATGTVVAFAEPGQARLLAHMHRDAGVSATVVPVRPGDEAVLELAHSGEPVPERPLPVRSERRSATGRRHPSRRRPGRGPVGSGAAAYSATGSSSSAPRSGGAGRLGGPGRSAGPGRTVVQSRSGRSGAPGQI
jgi:superfamily II DNA/RNA helicase